MTDISLTIERRDLQDRRFLQDRRISEQSGKGEQVRPAKQFPLVLEILCLFLVAATGLAVYKATGLYDAIESTAGQIVFGGGIICYFTVMFRGGLHRKF